MQSRPSSLQRRSSDVRGGGRPWAASMARARGQGRGHAEQRHDGGTKMSEKGHHRDGPFIRPRPVRGRTITGLLRLGFLGGLGLGRPSASRARPWRAWRFAARPSASGSRPDVRPCGAARRASLGGLLLGGLGGFGLGLLGLLGGLALRLAGGLGGFLLGGLGGILLGLAGPPAWRISAPCRRLQSRWSRALPRRRPGRARPLHRAWECGAVPSAGPSCASRRTCGRRGCAARSPACAWRSRVWHPAGWAAALAAAGAAEGVAGRGKAALAAFHVNPAQGRAQHLGRGRVALGGRRLGPRGAQRVDQRQQRRIVQRPKRGMAALFGQRQLIGVEQFLFALGIIRHSRDPWRTDDVFGRTVRRNRRVCNWKGPRSQPEPPDLFAGVAAPLARGHGAFDRRDEARIRGERIADQRRLDRGRGRNRRHCGIGIGEPRRHGRFDRRGCNHRGLHRR